MECDENKIKQFGKYKYISKIAKLSRGCYKLFYIAFEKRL